MRKMRRRDNCCKNTKKWFTMHGYQIELEDLPLHESRKHVLIATSLDMWDWTRYRPGSWQKKKCWKSYRKTQYKRIADA